MTDNEELDFITQIIALELEALEIAQTLRVYQHRLRILQQSKVLNELQS